MGGIDVKRLIGEVAARHRILLREDDPAFAIITLNELVLETTANDLIQKMKGLVGDFNLAADQVQTRAGTAIADEVRAAIESARSALKADLEVGGVRARELVMEVHRAHTRSAAVRWITVGLLAAVALLGCGVFLGMQLK
jgi:hypothetical protein